MPPATSSRDSHCGRGRKRCCLPHYRWRRLWKNYFEQPVACSDVAIYKFFAAGVLEFITYLAGETSENAGFVRLSPGGSLVVAGTTDSADFPVTAAALQPLFPALRTTP